MLFVIPFNILLDIPSCPLLFLFFREPISLIISVLVVGVRNILCGLFGILLR